jgi:hypothetical protein
MSFLYKAKLLDQEVFYKELKVYQHKKLLKCFISEQIQPDILIKNLNDIVIDNVQLSEKDINELSFIDYFLLVLYLRYTSIGDLIFAEINTDKKTKLEISISKLLNEFYSFNIKEFLQPTTFENFQITYKIPDIYSVLKLQDKNNQNTFYLYFIKDLKIGNQILDLKTFSDTDKQILFDNLPAKATAQIIKQTTAIVKQLNSFNILKFLPGFKEKIYFNLNLDNFCALIRLIFGGDLLSLYENIFALSKYGNLSPEYIEQCTPGEYLFFVKKLEELARKQATNNTPPSDMNESPFEDGLSG